MGLLNFVKAKTVLNNSILAEMNVDVAVNDASQVWVLHDRPFASQPDHLEFDSESGDLYFAGKDGTLIHLGMPVPAKSRAHMAKASEAHLFLVSLEPRQIKEHSVISILQTETGKED
jgi:hypothetical protein